MRQAKRGGLGILVLFPLACLAQPACADVITTSENGFVVRVAAEVTAKPADAWKTMISPAQWWSSEHTFSGDAANLTLDPVAGGCFCETLPRPADAPASQRAGSVQHMRVVYSEPPRAVRLVGALGPLQSEALSATLTMTVKPTGSGSRILFEYVVGGFMRYSVDEIVPAVDRMLASQLSSLAGKLGPVEVAPPPERKLDVPMGPPAPVPGAELQSAPSGTRSRDAGPLSEVDDYRLPPARSAIQAASEGASRAAALRGVEPATGPVTKIAAKPAVAAPPVDPAAAPKPPVKLAPKAVAKPAGKTAAKPLAKPVPKVPNPDDEAHRDANTAFDALLGAAPAPDSQN